VPTTITISLPEEMRAFIEERTRAGSFASTSEFIRQLVRQEQRRAEQERLEKKLLEGMDSGEPIRVTDEYWNKLRSRVERRANGRKTAKRQ